MEHNISYQPCKFQLSRMSGSDFTEEVGKTPSPVLGEEGPVLLGLKNPILEQLLKSWGLKIMGFSPYIFTLNLHFPGRQ